MTVKCDFYCRINNNCQFRGAEQTKCWNVFEGELFHLKCLFPFLLPLPICVCVCDFQPYRCPTIATQRTVFSISQSNEAIKFVVLFLLHFKSNLPCFLLHNHNTRTHTHASKQMSFNINKNLFGIFQKLLGKNSEFGFHYGPPRLFLVPTQTYLFLFCTID